MGTLLEGQRDASGQMYMRNRMYDPATGQFTQTDPIGLAGGLNTYGFAAGDPVSYSDPYGLCPPKFLCDLIGATAGEASTQYWAEVANNSLGIKRVAATAAGLFSALWTPDTYSSTVSTLIAAGRIGPAVEGVYEFIGEDGNLYVGQSGDVGGRMRQHVESGKVSENAEVHVTEVSGGRTQREIAE